MNYKFLPIVLCLILTFYCIPSYAFNEESTHPKLTSTAVDKSSLEYYLADYYGFIEGYEKKFKGIDRKGYEKNYSVLEWLQQGSTDEDAINFCRAQNHFHTPVKSTNGVINNSNWADAGVDDSMLQALVCGVGKKNSDLTWATGFIARNPPDPLNPLNYVQDRTTKYIGWGFPTPWLTDETQDMGWDHSRGYLYEALTANDPTVREKKIVKTFKAVGMVMHLLQDMAVPAHVRNDMSSHLINATSWGSNPFELYVVDNPAAISIPPIKPEFGTSFQHTDFWDNDSYTGDNPSEGKNQGLAEYTNANFVSDYTLFAPASLPYYHFKYPSESTSVAKELKTIHDPRYPTDDVSKTTSRWYFMKTGDGEINRKLNGETGYKLAGVNYLHLKALAGSSEEFMSIPPMDDNVHEDYAKLLLPRTVGYSAALLDYFFRGTMNITAAPGDITFRSIKLTAQNTTPNETMGIGDVSLVIRYKALSETDLGGGKYLLNLPANDYSYKVVPLPAKVDMSSPQTLTFDFGNDPLPMNFADMTMQLVYRGQLGNETDAVAVSKPEVIDGIYTDMELSLPSSGVYAKTASDADNATFTELRVNVATDMPGGLTGGKFQLELEYRSALGNQFINNGLETEPANATAYIFKKAANGNISSLQPGEEAELVFDLSSLPLSVQSTDIEVNIVYVDKTTGKIKASGVKNVSEPNPVDVFNNTDYSCLNGQWYRYDHPALADSNGIAKGYDIYPHAVSNISFLAAAAGSGALDASTASTLTAPGPLSKGEMLRLGYILTEYNNRYAYSALRTGPEGDSWPPTVSNNSYAGSGYRNDDTSWSNMFTFRNRILWWGTGVVFTNRTNNTSCTWDSLSN